MLEIVTEDEFYLQIEAESIEAALNSQILKTISRELEKIGPSIKIDYNKARFNEGFVHPISQKRLLHPVVSLPISTLGYVFVNSNIKPETCGDYVRNSFVQKDLLELRKKYSQLIRGSLLFSGGCVNIKSNLFSFDSLGDLPLEDGQLELLDKLIRLK